MRLKIKTIFLLFLLIGGEIWRDIFDKLCKIMDNSSSLNIWRHSLNTNSSELYLAELLNRHAESIQNSPSIQKHPLMRDSGLLLSLSCW